MKRNKIGLVLCSSILALGAISLSIVRNNKSSNVLATGNYSQSVNDYYSSISWDLTGASLKTALFNKIKITTAGWSYDGLWEAYKTSDVRPDGTHFWDIYSDWTDYTLNDKRINASYKKEGDSINREHVIPQSSFNEAAPMKSDIHHVLPSDGYVNNRRSAYPHGIVTGSPTYTSHDGCKLGSGATGQGTVFEPMDHYKGDIARIYFYFVTCYQDKMSSNSFNAFDKSTYPSIKSIYLSTYLQWAKDDPVSEKEIIRNQAAYVGQGNRNPFIDCPYAVGAIWDPDHATDYGNKGEYTSGEGISISKSSVSLISGSSTTITATTTNSSNITWTTSNSSVAAISSSSTLSGGNLTITAGTSGTATVSATATIGGKVYTKSCTVNVSATKQVVSISVSGQQTAFTVDDTFTFGGVVTATYNDETTENVTSSSSFTGYDMSSTGNQTVTVSYSYGGVTATTSYGIIVNTAGGGGSEDISDYTVSTDVLTSSNVVNGMKVAFGTSPTNLATGIDSNWIRLSTSQSDWLVFTLEGDSSGFTLKHGELYIYCSGEKKVSFNESGSTLKIIANNLVNSSVGGTFYYNGSGLRPYTSGSYTEAYLYPLIPNKSLVEIDIDTYPNKTTYTVGDKFDPTGLVISRTYDDSSSDKYAYAGHASEFTFIPSPVTPLTIDDDTVEVVYGGQSCFFEIDVEYPDVLESIEISGYTTSFIEGDAFTFGGMVLAHFESGSVLDVTSSCTFDGYDMTEVGQQTVTVSYLDQSETYQINVAIGTLSSLTLSDQTTVYTKNAHFSFDGTCIAVFENDYQKVVTPTSVSSPDMSKTGTEEVTVTYTYNGKTVTATYDITINSYREVIEETESLIGTVTYTSGSEEISVNTLSTSKSGYTNIENGPDASNKALRLGSGSNKGTLTITSTTSNIYRVVVNARTYNTDSPVTMTIGGSSNSLTTSYAEYEKDYTTATNSVAIATTTNGKRAWIKTVAVYTKAEQDIGQTEDCIGLETFINTYMHMDYVDDLGYCKDSEHHYYSTAKAAFNELNDHQRELFTSNVAYEHEWERLQAWAYFNGDSLNETTFVLEANHNIVNNDLNSDNHVIIIVMCSAISASFLLSILLILKKRKKR